jgi:hypothetical protein
MDGSWIHIRKPTGVFPLLIERLRGTAARATELNGKWSVKEHLGHLVDLQLSDQQRLREFLARAPVLSPADSQNRATENANHRRVPIADILRRLRTGSSEFVSKLGGLAEDEVVIPSIHPRLQKTMRLDWASFLAEYHDHHLARVRQLMLNLNETRFCREGAKP